MLLAIAVSIFQINSVWGGVWMIRIYIIYLYRWWRERGTCVERRSISRMKSKMSSIQSTLIKSLNSSSTHWRQIRLYYYVRPFENIRFRSLYLSRRILNMYNVYHVLCKMSLYVDCRVHYLFEWVCFYRLLEEIWNLNIKSL